MSADRDAHAGELSRVRERVLASVAADADGLVTEYLARFGRVLNADNASELFPDYAASPATRATRVAAVRPAAARIVDLAFARLLAEPVAPDRARLAVFTSGGNGAGKSTSLAPDDPAHAIVDSTLSRVAPSRANIDRALSAGLDVEIRHQCRDVEEAWDAVLTRAMGEGQGRTVTLAGCLDTHVGARHSLLALADIYATDPRVRIVVIDNSVARGRVPRDLAWLRAQPQIDVAALAPRLRHRLEAARAEGRISDGVYQGCRG